MENYIAPEYIKWVTDWAVSFVPRFILALLVLWLGMKLANRVFRIIRKAIQRSNIDREVEEFLGSMLNIVLKIAVIVIAASIVGVKFSALFGVLAAAGFAIGLALQGFLGNFASGLTIVFFKPYKVGDWVEISETFGRVQSIEIFSTTLITPGEKTLIIPNGQVTDNIITNFSTRGKIRLELQVTMPYEESFPKIKEIILNALENCPDILHDPAPIVGIETYDSHNIILAVRPYIHPDNYWNATFDVYSKIKEAFYKSNIKVAYSEGIELGDIGD